MSNDSLTQLLNQSNILWRASHTDYQSSIHSTGYLALDKKLYDGGWPQGLLCELIIPHSGAGELQLLTPLLAGLTQSPGYQVWVNPPLLPYAPTLLYHKIDLNKQLLIQHNHIPTLVWATFQALTSQSCSLVLIWLPAKTPAPLLRKLALAVRQSPSYSIMIRNQSALNSPSPARLRLQLTPIKGGPHQITIIKQPNGWGGQSLSLPLLPEQSDWTDLSASQWPQK